MTAGANVTYIFLGGFAFLATLLEENFFSLKCDRVVRQTQFRILNFATKGNKKLIN